MSVISESNKQILWEVLNGLIDGNNLEIQNINQFRNFFENQLVNLLSMICSIIGPLTLITY